MTRFIRWTTLSLFVVAVTPVFAQDPQRAAQDKLLAAEVPAVQKACGVPLAVSIDWSTFAGVDAAATGGAAESCTEGLRGLIQGCTAYAEDRLAFQRLYKSFVCGYGGAGKGRTRTGNGTITYAFDPTDKNNPDAVEGAVFGLIK